MLEAFYGEYFNLYCDWNSYGGCNFLYRTDKNQCEKKWLCWMYWLFKRKKLLQLFQKIIYVIANPYFKYSPVEDVALKAGVQISSVWNESTTVNFSIPVNVEVKF